MHLGLTPLIDPRRNRLRELWVDTTSLLPLAAKDGGVFIARETALAPLDFGRPGLLHDVVFTFRGLTLSSKYPFATSSGIMTPAVPLGDP